MSLRDSAFSLLDHNVNDPDVAADVNHIDDAFGGFLGDDSLMTSAASSLSHSTTFAPSGAQLFVPLQLLHVVGQTALAKVEIHSQKAHDILHVVLKNGPFDVTLQLNEPGSFDGVKISVELLYSHSLAAVPHVKGEAVSFEVPERDSNRLVLRARVQALSSKHEKMNFVLRVSLLDDATGVPLGNHAAAFTAPIKVVSKPPPISPSCSDKSAKVRRNTKKSSADDGDDGDGDGDDDVDTACGQDASTSAELESNNVARASSVMKRNGSSLTKQRSNSKRRRAEPAVEPAEDALTLKALFKQQQILSEKIDALLALFVKQERRN
jgi:hypothetical protein